jgi:hypothetical protein
MSMDTTDLEVLSCAVERLLGQPAFPATLEALEAELARSPRNYVWVAVELSSIPVEPPPHIKSCWIFHLRRDEPSGAHYHPNSVQHMVMVRGRGMSNVGGVLRPLIPFASPAASLAEKWLVIGRGVTHEFTPDGENMTVVSFHTCRAGELVEIDCGTGTARRYEPPGG